MQRIKTSLPIGLTDDAPRGDGRCEALELLETQIDHLKQPNNQPVGTASNHDGVWLGKGLQARR
ncbi:hypothetical protein D3C87_2194110 [compost metagenome]